MLIALGQSAARFVGTKSPWVGAYGIARSLLASATALTLLANPASTLFHPTGAAPVPPVSDGIRAAGLFALAGPTHLDAARIAAAFLLIVVATGYRPRWTGPLHAWVAWSFAVATTVVDGGDQVSSNLAILLVPATLLDRRRWQWDPLPARAATDGEIARRIVARTAIGLCQLQVAGVYFHAAVGKMAVEEWADGTALYYWFTHPVFGAPGWLQPVVRAVVLAPLGVALLTWGVILLELMLAGALFMRARPRRVLLIAGVAMHLGIIVLHGLASFGTIMVASLLLYLHPVGRPVPLPAFARTAWATLARAARARVSASIRTEARS
jgi:antimicrobial peptide system SdpB family protein